MFPDCNPFDKNGNQLTKEEWEYWENNLVSNNTWQYHYDGLNQIDEVVTPSAER